MGKLIRDIIEESGKKYADLDAVKWLVKKEIAQRSYGDMLEQIAVTRAGLREEGFRGKHIALIGSTSVWWIESYLAVVTGENVAVPLDAGLPADELAELINRSDSEGLFLGEKQSAMAETFLAACPALKKIWLMRDEPDGAPGGRMDTLAELKAAGGRENGGGDNGLPKADDIATIIYTSGTTGKSKGVMLTQANLAKNVENVEFYAKPGCVLLSVLPIHHAFCLVMDWLKGFSLGAVLCINDSLLHMMKNMKTFRPNVMLMVPLMVETIYKRLEAEAPKLPKKLIGAAVFGGKLKTIFVGGAHLDPFYIEQFAKYGIGIYEGYGMSECSPVISCNTPEVHREGSIGKPLANAEISFADGEILVRGSSVMKGYYKMPEETAETLADGWLHTGDKGYLDEDGFLFINGRVKNLIILSNGENISPEELENKLGLHKLVAEVVVTGENNGLTARIYPDPDAAAKKKLSEDAVRGELQEFLDEYNRKQPTYRQITGLVIRKYPFARNATRKIIRGKVLDDEPLS